MNRLEPVERFVRFGSHAVRFAVRCGSGGTETSAVRIQACARPLSYDGFGLERLGVHRKRYLFPVRTEKNTIFGLERLGKHRKRYLFPVRNEKGTFFGLERLGKHRKRYLFFLIRNEKGTFFGLERLGKHRKRCLFSVFSKPLKPIKSAFFVPDRKKVPFSVLSKPLKPEKFFQVRNQKGTFFWA